MLAGALTGTGEIMATIDTSMYRQNPLRSVADYEGELLQNDLRKQGVEQNALALQTGRMGIEDRQRAMREADSIRNALAGLGGGATDEARIAALKGTGLPGGFAQADALQKSMLDRQKTVADIGKSTVDAEKATLETALKKQSHIAQLAGTATDQASWERAIQLASYVGADVSKIPPQYDPVIAQQLAQTALTSQQQLEQRLKDMQFAEQVRQNKSEDANRMLVSDGYGRFVPNQPLISAKTQVARAGASAINNYGSPVAGVDADGKPVFFQPAKAGGAPAIVPGVRPPKDPNAEKPLTEGQGIATTFAARMQDAARVIKDLESAGVSGSDLSTIAAGNRVTNVLSPEEGQRYRQAQENWVTANLRKESGAAIPVEEMEKDIAKWFPKIGDKKEVREQKARARAVAEQGMLVQAGPGAKQVAGILERSGREAAPSRAASSASPADIDELLKKYGK